MHSTVTRRSSCANFGMTANLGSGGAGWLWWRRLALVAPAGSGGFGGSVRLILPWLSLTLQSVPLLKRCKFL